jgi:hypothetical protein
VLIGGNNENNTGNREGRGNKKSVLFGGMREYLEGINFGM